MWAGLAMKRTLCAVCRRWGAALVCADCTDRHAAPGLRCPRCALRLLPGATVCAACVQAPPLQSSTLCALDYAFPWDTLIGRFKFDGQIDLVAALAGPLLRAIRADDGSAPEWVVPVPLSRERLAQRGYNQAGLLAHHLASQLGLDCRAEALLRLIDTPEQARLDRAGRLANLRAAIAVNPALRARLAGRAIALVDDVMTTGTTVAECTRTLLAAGAASVQVWVLARTPAGAD